MMDDRRALSQLLAALLIGLAGVVTTLLLLSKGASAQPMLQEQADLAITKTGDPDSVAAGETLTYTLVIMNSGPVTATNVVVTDTLPAGVTFQSATRSQGTCGGTNVVTCSVGNVIVSQTAMVTLVVAVDPATRGALSNVAEVSADEADPVLGDNTATAVTTVTAEADLALTKTGDPDQVVAGETLTYTLTATNNGPSDSAGVVVTDTLPLSVTLVTSATTQGWYNGATGVWTVGSLTDGGSATLTLTVTVDPSARGTLSNVAEVSGDEFDPAPDNNGAGQGTPVDPQADLAVAKTDALDPVSAGNPLTYTLTVTNSGPSDATGITLVDDLPDEVSLFSATSSQGACVPVDDSVTCDVGALASGANVTVSVVVTVTSPLPNGTILTNLVTVDGNESDLNDVNDSAQEQTTVQSSPVLTITKADDPDPVDEGGTLLYTLVVTNSGNEDATSVIVTEHYDPNVSFVLANPFPDDYGSGNRVWTLGTVTVGDPETIVIGVIVAAPLPPGTVLTNQVTLDSDQTAPLTVTEFTAVTSRPVFTVTKSDLSDPVYAGEGLKYWITYLNLGTDAPHVVITETYDSRVTFDSADPPPDVGDNVWDIGYLPKGAFGHIVVTVTVPTPLTNGTVLTNLVTMDDRVYPAPQSVTETTRVSSAPDLTFSVADHPDPVDAGDLLTYTLRYTNVGNADATGVVVTATLDVSTTFSGAAPSPDGGSDRVRVWDVGTIPGEGGDGEILVYASVPISLPDGTPLLFTAQLDDAEGDLLKDTASTRVRTLPDLTIGNVGHDWEEGHKPSLFSPGKQMDYIVTYGNVGYEDAQDVVITTTLPPGTSYKEIGYGWQPAGDGLYTYLVDSLDPGSTGHVITFTVTYADVPCVGVRGSTTPFTIAPRGGLVGDANPADNATSVTIGVPDLVVTGFGVEPWPLEPDEPVAFTVTLKNQGVAPAWSPEDPEFASYLDIFTAPVPSCPYGRDSEKDIWDFQPVLYPGDEYTMVITLSRNWDWTPKGPITFTQEEIDEILTFYVKLDNSDANHYGYIPESNEMNNIFPRARYLYLPMVLR